MRLRHIALSQQGLTSKQAFGKGLSATRKAIEHLGYVQIDTLSVVERAHHHVLWNRVPDYDTRHLNQLIKGQHIFEYWFHAASYLPMRDYRYALPQMKSIRDGENRYYNKVDQKLMKDILARVRIDGPLGVRDLGKTKSAKRHSKKGSKNSSGWWDYGPSKRAVSRLFMQGDLMVCERIGMKKIYDIAERCLPKDIDLSMPTIDEYAAYLFDTTLRAHGVFNLKQLLHLKTGQPIKSAMEKVLDHAIEAGRVKEVGKTLLNTYVATDTFVPQLDRKNLKILSPFDNLLIHRDRLSALFEYDYRIECYVNKAKRVFGYFCLPILFCGKLVARIDCKAHRTERRLEVLSLHLENAALDRAVFFSALIKELKCFAEFNQCPIVDLRAIEKLM